MIVVDKLIKVAHFIPTQSIFKAIQVAYVFMIEIFRLHGVYKTIISYGDVNFTSNFLKELFTRLDTQLNCSTTYHPQIHGRYKITNQILENMLHMYEVDQSTKYEF